MAGQRTEECLVWNADDSRPRKSVVQGHPTGYFDVQVEFDEVISGFPLCQRPENTMDKTLFRDFMGPGPAWMRRRARTLHSFRGAWVAFRTESSARYENRPGARDAWRPAPVLLRRCRVARTITYTARWLRRNHLHKFQVRKEGAIARLDFFFSRTLPGEFARAKIRRGHPDTGHAQQGRYRHAGGSGEQQSKIGDLAQPELARQR